MTGYGPGPGPQPGAYPGGGYERDPFAYDPFAAPPGAPVPAAGPGHSGNSSHSGHDAAPVLPVLSILFAFLCAPVGALLGHIALTQDTDQRGRNLALVGVTLSYVFIVVALVAWGVAEAMY